MLGPEPLRRPGDRLPGDRRLADAVLNRALCLGGVGVGMHVETIALVRPDYSCCCNRVCVDSVTASSGRSTPYSQPVLPPRCGC